MQGGRTFLRDFIPLSIDEKKFSRLWSHIDITERKQAEDELQKSEARYHLLADNSIDVIWTIDPEGIFTYLSPSVVHLVGWTPEEVIGQPISKLVSREDPPDGVSCCDFRDQVLPLIRWKPGAKLGYISSPLPKGPS